MEWIKCNLHKPNRTAMISFLSTFLIMVITWNKTNNTMTKVDKFSHYSVNITTFKRLINNINHTL